KDSHLFVLPSKSEGLPRAIIEAMATGNPCIGSNVDGIPELLDREYIVDGFNYSDYSKKIISLVSDWPKMIQSSNSNYENSKKFHSRILTNKRNLFYSRLKNL